MNFYLKREEIMVSIEAAKLRLAALEGAQEMIEEIIMENEEDAMAEHGARNLDVRNWREENGCV